MRMESTATEISIRWWDLGVADAKGQHLTTRDKVGTFIVVGSKGGVIIRVVWPLGFLVVANWSQYLYRSEFSRETNSLVFDRDEASTETCPQRDVLPFITVIITLRQRNYPELSKITKYWLWIYINNNNNATMPPMKWRLMLDCWHMES